MERINELLSRGLALTAQDVRELQSEIAVLPLGQAHEAEPWVWEAVALIVNDPDYAGDAKLPDSD